MEYKLICTNIRFENEADAPQLWSARKLVLKKIIETFLPDIIGTQEGRRPQHMSLNSLISLELIDTHREWIEERMYPCIYLNLSTFALVESGDFWLSTTPTVAGSKSFKSIFPRLCTWVRVKNKFSKEFYVFNTHLDHTSIETRKKQSEVLIQEIIKINKEKIPLILMGDFNETPLGEIHIEIEKKINLKDAWLKAKNIEEASHHGFLNNTPNKERIDWIFIPEDFEIKNIFFDKTSENGIFPSDHYPLVATVIPN